MKSSWNATPGTTLLKAVQYGAIAVAVLVALVSYLSLIHI